MLGRAGAAVLVGLCCLVSGCNGGDPPPSNPTVTTSTSAVATTTAAPSTTAPPTGAPVLPDAARQQTPEGAEAFVRHWYATLEYSWSVMQSAPIRTLGECLSCANYADTIDAVAADGKRIVGGDITVNLADGTVTGQSTAATVAAVISASEQTVQDSAGAQVAVLSEALANSQFLFDLSWQADTWSVTSIRIVE